MAITYEGNINIQTTAGVASVAYFTADVPLANVNESEITTIIRSTPWAFSSWYMCLNNVPNIIDEFKLHSDGTEVVFTKFGSGRATLTVTSTNIGASHLILGSVVGYFYVGQALYFIKASDLWGFGRLSTGVIYTEPSGWVSPTSTSFGFIEGTYSNAGAAGLSDLRILSDLVQDFNAIIDDVIIPPGPIPGVDPYSGGGTSEPGGGDGDFDFSSTDIPIPSLPAIGSYDTGFISLYNPSASQLKALAAYMWSGAFDLDNFRKLVADPMDAILGLHIIPTIAGHPATGSATLMVGNISTGITMPTVTEQYYELDCGTINISPKWGAYLDYSPYSKLTLFLPYIGFVPISPDDCMNGTIRVVYHVDVLSGTCCAYVYCESNRGADGHTLYTFTGSCACDCPVTEGQYTNALFGMLNVVGGIAQVAMSAGVAGAAGIPGTAQGLQNVANAAISMAKPDIARSGDFGGSAGLMGIQYPYLVLTVPRMCTPEDQNVYIGYPSFITREMSELSGYTEIQVSHLSGMSCTSGEADEIIALLGGGVIF